MVYVCRMKTIILKLIFLLFCGKKFQEGATVAVGVSSWHKVEAESVITDAFKGV